MWSKLLKNVKVALEAQLKTEEMEKGSMIAFQNHYKTSYQASQWTKNHKYPFKTPIYLRTTKMIYSIKNNKHWEIVTKMITCLEL